MTDAASRLEYRPLRAPRGDRTALVEPPLEAVPALIAENLRRRSGYEYDVQGRRLADLAVQARREFLDEARRWTSAYRDVNLPAHDPQALFFLAGHQPQLFHPGVWFKDFALGWLAQQHRGVAINLVVDSDTMKMHTVRVPGGSVTAPHVAMIPMDEPGPIVPFEERSILDPGVFADFGRRAAEESATLVPNPMLREYWPLAVERGRRSGNLGQSLAQSRHQWEGQWGLQTLEVPQSCVCQLPSFAWFTIHLLAELPRLVSVYNEVVAEYRRVHHIRSTSHPVPDLAIDGPWHEAPYWVWTAQDPRRRRLFVRRGANELVLSDRRGWNAEIPFSPDDDAGHAAESLLEMGCEGVRIRSRALVTTLWARLVLSDLFLHGIGGAKYDQVTDALMARFFGLQPPGILVLSATLQLPIPRPPVTPDDARAISRQLRDLIWHPETAVPRKPCPGRGGELAELIAAKRRWIETPQALENGRNRWREIRRINEAFQPWVAGPREQLEEHKVEVAAALRAEKILGSREYGFCLYPADTLREFFFGLLPRTLVNR